MVLNLHFGEFNFDGYVCVPPQYIAVKESLEDRLEGSRQEGILEHDDDVIDSRMIVVTAFTETTTLTFRYFLFVTVFTGKFVTRMQFRLANSHK